jgi:hypothetical protein
VLFKNTRQKAFAFSEVIVNHVIVLNYILGFYGWVGGWCMKKAGKNNMGFRFNTILFLVCIFAVSAQGANLLTNGNFNTGDLTGWEPNIPNLVGIDIQAVVQTAFNYDGTPCLFMRYRTTGIGVEIHQVVPVAGLPTIRLSFVANKWTWGDAAAEIGWYSGGVPDPNFPDANLVSSDTYIIAQNGDETGGWGSFTYDYTVPPTAQYAILRLRASDWVWNVYIDSVYFGEPDNNQPGVVAPWPNSTVPREDKSNCGYGPTLQWTAATAATGNHYVYFGTSFADVNDANTNDPEFKASLPLGTTTYTLSLAQVNREQSYFWRIDETVGSNVIKSENVWPFSVGNFTWIDRFDNYLEDWILQAVWGPNSTGAADFNMQINYGSSQNAVSADTSALLCSNNISENSILVLMVKGHDNMKGPNNIYVTLESNSGAQSGTVHFREPNALNQQLYESMILWPVALQEFASQGVVLTNVTKITIGVDNGSGGPPGGTGTVTINDVRLDYPWCDSTLAELIPADFTKDCYVGLTDLDLLATNWLAASTVVTAVAPSAGPVLWYKFDESSGNPADSSGHIPPYNGTISYPFAWGGAGTGIGGTNCFYPNNTDRVTIPIAAINDHNTIGAESTISVWLKDPGQTDADSEILQIGHDSNVIGIWSGATGAFSYAAGWDSNNGWGDNLQYPTQQNFTNPDHPQDKWVHYAFVKSVSGHYMKIYRNGRLIALNDNATASETTVLGGAENFATLGAWRWSGGYGGYYNGWIDDFRIYNYALSPGEVLYLAVEGGTATSPMTQGLFTPADATGNDKVDFYDFAVMAQYWLQDLVWP